FLFFFSSRRRHTRSTRDWSSDVCSSDLTLAGGGAGAQAQAGKRIDQYAPELDKIISTSEQILELGTGFGVGGNTEGPVWWKEGEIGRASCRERGENGGGEGVV